MSKKIKGLVASLAFATSMISANGPASADTLALLGLDHYPDQCDLRLTRAALALDLTIPENLSGVTEVFCGCEVVSVQMLEFIRRHRHLEVLLDETSQQCGGFANVLARVSTASTGKTDAGSGGSDHRDSDKVNGGGIIGGGGNGGSTGGGDNGGSTGGGDNGGSTGGGDNGGSTGGGDNGGSTGGGDNGGSTGGGDNGGSTDGGDNGGSTDGGDNGGGSTGGGDNGGSTDGGDNGGSTDGGDNGGSTDGGDNGKPGKGDHDHGKPGKGDRDHDKGGRGDRDHDKGGRGDRDRDRNC